MKRLIATALLTASMSASAEVLRVEEVAADGDQLQLRVLCQREGVERKIELAYTFPLALALQDVLAGRKTREEIAVRWYELGSDLTLPGWQYLQGVLNFCLWQPTP